jgi:hypothetical protein
MWSSVRRTVPFRISLISRFHSSIPITGLVFTRTRVVSRTSGSGSLVAR